MWVSFRVKRPYKTAITPNIIDETRPYYHSISVLGQFNYTPFQIAWNLKKIMLFHCGTANFHHSFVPIQKYTQNKYSAMTMTITITKYLNTPHQDVTHTEIP